MSTTISQRLSQAERSEETKALIISAATKLFARHGFERTSTDRIAKEAGVSQGIIFHYFKTKKDLFWMIVSQPPKVKGADYYLDYTKANPDLTPVEKLRLFVKHLVKIAELYPELTEIRVRHVFSMDLTSEPEVFENLEKTIAQFEGIFIEGVSSGVFRSDLNTRKAVYAFMGIFNYNYLLWTMMGRKGDLQTELEEALEMLIGGLLKR